MITVAEVRLVNEKGDMLGVVPIAAALEAAAAAGLDLIEVAPQAQPPVCKILDYGKYRYEEQKRQHEAKRKQKVILIKEIKLTPTIDEHDYQVKLKAIRRFISEGDKVKVSLRFRGREIAYKDLASALYRRVVEDLKDDIKVEQHAKLEGQQMIMLLAPAGSAK